MSLQFTGFPVFTETNTLDKLDSFWLISPKFHLTYKVGPSRNSFNKKLNIL